MKKAFPQLTRTTFKLVDCISTFLVTCFKCSQHSTHLLDFVNLLLKLLDVLLGVSSSSVGSVESNFELVDVLFQFLLASKRLGFASCLRFQTRLH